MRYAIYLTPPEGDPLADAAARWLGRSPFDETPRATAAPASARADVPARYGFHATLKAPFRLAEGADEPALLEAFHQAYAGPPLVLRLTIAPLSRFLAFRTEDEAAEAAARRAVEAFEPLRAPLTVEERARRRPERLDAHGLALLERWGYPYVMDRFTFHMTLTGPLDLADAASVADAAHGHFAEHDGAHHRLVHAVYREDEPGGPFRVIATEAVRQ
ncbi:DUF1045 domain-containing protein [Acuticoccus sp.]|uniref:DUF1045 domain-containing protein n=1 Tax=Acuticoccus sp. TaxID=1904378 RepID=UPI003B52875D